MLHHRSAFEGVTASLVALHITSNAKSLATALMRAFERLFASMAMGVNPEARRSREGLVASWADVPILRLRECSGGGWGYIMVMLPWVCSR
jgi:hypothetical protein